MRLQPVASGADDARRWQRDAAPLAPSPRCADPMPSLNRCSLQVAASAPPRRGPATAQFHSCQTFQTIMTADLLGAALPASASGTGLHESPVSGSTRCRRIDIMNGHVAECRAAARQRARRGTLPIPRCNQQTLRLLRLYRAGARCSVSCSNGRSAPPASCRPAALRAVASSITCALPVRGRHAAVGAARALRHQYGRPASSTPCCCQLLGARHSTALAARNHVAVRRIRPGCWAAAGRLYRTDDRRGQQPASR